MLKIANYSKFLKEISAIKMKLERLMDAYLAEALELSEFQQTKNALMAEKKTKEGRSPERSD